MKKLVFLSTVFTIVLSLLLGSAAMAAPAGKDIKANNNPQNLYLYPKEYADAPEWTTLWEAKAWGKYNFKINGQVISGVFNGHGLTPDTEYSLISYNDPWGTPCVVIGSSTSDANGNVHIAGNADLGDDVASPIYDWSDPGDGYKIWLVLTADITEGMFNAWNPGAYLFENNRIGATATAPAP